MSLNFLGTTMSPNRFLNCLDNVNVDIGSNDNVRSNRHINNNDDFNNVDDDNYGDDVDENNHKLVNYNDINGNCDDVDDDIDNDDDDDVDGSNSTKMAFFLGRQNPFCPRCDKSSNVAGNPSLELFGPIL